MLIRIDILRIRYQHVSPRNWFSPSLFHALIVFLKIFKNRAHSQRIRERISHSYHHLCFWKTSIDCILKSASAWTAQSPLIEGQLSSRAQHPEQSCLGHLTWIKCFFPAPLWGTSFSLILDILKTWDQNKIRKKKNISYPRSEWRVDGKLLALTLLDSQSPCEGRSKVSPSGHTQT